jgi:anti-sigma factor RsiW
MVESSQVAGEAACRPSCDEFLTRYSDYVDGRMSAAQEAQWRQHVACCASCARYDRTARRAGELLGQLSTASVADDFEFRLRHRLVHMEEEERERTYASGTSVATAVLIAGMMAAVAWSPVLRRMAGRERPGVAVTAPAVTSPVAVEGAGADLHRVTPLLATSPNAASPADGPQPDIAPLFTPTDIKPVTSPGLYSPLIIHPPAFRLATMTRVVGVDVR